MISSIDDLSRMLLFADFASKDTTWAHIQAAQALMQPYGIPLRYYVDSAGFSLRPGWKQLLAQA